MSDEEEDTVTYVLEVKFNRTTKLPVFQRARLDGLRQDLPDGTPSEIAYDEWGRVNCIARHDRDQPHCENAAAIIHINPDSGVQHSEQFFDHGKPYVRERGPRQITRNRRTGETIRKYYQNTDGSIDAEDHFVSDGRASKPRIEP